VARAALLEPQARLGEDAVVQATAIVDDHDDLPARREGGAGAAQDLGDALAVAGDAAADLLGVAPLEPEELEGVDVLLVVVDQPRVGR
jgi:hypothetical protein